MALAESVEFKHGLYTSCGIECFDGILLEPCLLQPCFHVAGPCLKRRFAGPCPKVLVRNGFLSTAYDLA